MSKRISVKGRGLGAYFPNEDEGSPSSGAPAEAPSQVAPPTSVAPTASPPESDKVSQGRPRPTKRVAGNPDSARLEGAESRITEPAYVNAAFRFSGEELTALDDTVYELKKKYGAKLTKQDIMRLSLANLLSDYETNGGESVLAQYAQKGKRPGR